MTAVQMIFHLEHRDVGAETDITRIGAGWLLGMSILLLLAYPNLRNARRNLLFVIVALPLLSAGLIASAARGPMVSLAIALPLTLLWFAKKRFLALAVAALLIVSCVASFVLSATRGSGQIQRQTKRDDCAIEWAIRFGIRRKKIELL